MHQRHRLRSSLEIDAVRKQGRAKRHPLGVLVFRPNQLPHSRFCFSASKRVGNAVQRNRARRLLREAVRINKSRLAPGWDCILIARTATVTASFEEVEAAVLKLYNRARLLPENDVNESEELRVRDKGE